MRSTFGWAACAEARCDRAALSLDTPAIATVNKGDDFQFHSSANEWRAPREYYSNI